MDTRAAINAYQEAQAFQLNRMTGIGLLSTANKVPHYLCQFAAIKEIINPRWRLENLFDNLESIKLKG